jgi:PhnB protein
MQLQAYLFFSGRCDEALAFYRATVGAEVAMLMRFRDGPEEVRPATLPPGWEDKVMHASVRIGDSGVLMSDGSGSGQTGFQGFALSLTVADLAEAGRVFAALGDGGAVRMPMAPTFFSPGFGMLTDRFGIGWMVYVAA